MRATSIVTRQELEANLLFCKVLNRHRNKVQNNAHRKSRDCMVSKTAKTLCERDHI